MKMKQKSLMKNDIKIWPIVCLIIVAFFGILHYQDVRAGAAATGDTWLKSWYIALLIFVLLGTCGVIYAFFGKVKKIQLSLTAIYPFIAVFLGLLYLFVLAPLSAPDEISHYISAYELSNRFMFKEADYETGNVLIRSEDLFLEDSKGAADYELDDGGTVIYFDSASEHSGEYEVLGQTLTEETYSLIHDVGLGGEDIPQADKVSGSDTAVSVYPPVITTPLAYVPQAVGITIARLLGLNSIWLVWFGRLFNLAFFVAVTTLAMRRLPFGKEVLFGVALLPMTLHLSASLSYDVMIMACLFLFTAICLDLAYDKEKVGPLDVIALAVLMAVAGPCKLVYVVMIGLCLLIPVKKFGGWGRWALSALVVAGLSLIAMILVNGQVIAGYAAATTEEMVPWAEEAGYSFSYIIRHPGQSLQLIYNTLIYEFGNYHLTMIGSSLGNLDPVLNVPYILVMGFTAGLIGLALKKPGESSTVTGGRRAWIFILCAACAGALMLSMLISWTPLGSSTIAGVQGRYFLPILPVFLIAVKNDRVVLTKDENRSILYLMFCANGYVLLRLFATICLRV